MEKITRIYNPIDIKLINLRAQETTEFELPSKYILFVGRLCPVKNLSLLLDAFELISASYTDLNLVIIGSGELNREYQNKKNKSKCIFF
ncbi:glycosyltransferase [Bacteroides fragilis]